YSCSRKPIQGARMLGAAPTCRSRRLALFALVSFAALLAATSPGALGATKSAPIGIELNGHTWTASLETSLAKAKTSGANAVVTLRNEWSTTRHRRLVAAATHQKLRLIEP